MPENEEKPIPFITSEWKGKEMSYRTDRVNIKLKVNLRKPDEKEIKEKSEKIAGTVINSKILRVSNKTGMLILEVPEGTDIIQLVEILSKNKDIVFAEPDQLGTILATPNDPRLIQQWALSKINALGAWDLEKGANNVLIGIIDTGISHYHGSLSHPDLDDTSRFILGTNFIHGFEPNDNHGHGTHVTGIAAAETNNEIGIAGMNWSSPVYICKVIGSTLQGDAADFHTAVEEIIDYAVAHNMKVVINASVGWSVDSDTFRSACHYVQDHGMILCAGSGNTGGEMLFPAAFSLDFSGVISVGSTDIYDNVSATSSRGPALTVVAPGVQILSTYPTYNVGLYEDDPVDFHIKTGTSMATPHVTGLASLIWSRVWQLTNDQVKNVIKYTAIKLGSGDFDNTWGYGRIQADVAVAKAGWKITPRQLNLNFIDVPENETQMRAIRFDVNSFHGTSFEMSQLPTAPFVMYLYSSPVTIGNTSDYDTPREVYLWVKYTGTVAGATDSGRAKVRCIETGEEFDVTITANTIARPTCAMMLVLDKSGSMLKLSGVDNLTRQNILVSSANIFADIVREKNGVGIVTFDHNAYDLLHPVSGPLNVPEAPHDEERRKIMNAIENYTVNPNGNTAIGDGIERGFNNLSGITSYDKKAIIVFTDGHETSRKHISEISSMINSQVFAVGLGTVNELNPGALNDICNNNDGYLVLTSHLDNDDTFKLAKYFLQIQAAVNNEQIVVDPSGYIAPGETVKVSFDLNEGDISVDAIAMFPVQEMLQIEIETPDGHIINSSNVATFPTIKKINNKQMTYYRITLPADNGSTVHAQTGTWNMILKIDENYYKKYRKQLEGYLGYYRPGHGVKYTALVHAYSNLRMKCTLSQNQYEPGAIIHMRSVITEYGAPLAPNCSVTASVRMPDRSETTLTLNKVDTGVYEAQMNAYMQGVYTFTIHANGKTSRNNDFTREEVRTGLVWKGGDNPAAGMQDNQSSNNPSMDEILCKFLHCLDKNLDKDAQERIRKLGLNLDGLIKCTCNK